MTFKYLLRPSHEDSHQTSTHWIALVLPFKNRDSFDRQTFVGSNAAPGASVSIKGMNPVEISEPLVLDNEVLSWSVNHSKRSPTGSCNLSLAPTHPFKRLVAGGDWILFWAFDNREDYERIRENLRSRPFKKSNFFMDGLKFVGRVAGVRSSRRRTGTGPVLTGYTLTATSFGEMESTIYYDSALQAVYGSNSLQNAVDFGGFINNYILGTETGAVNGGVAIQKLLNVCVGLGPDARWKQGVNSSLTDSEGNPLSTLIASPNGKMLIPQEVANLLLDPTVATGVERSFRDIISSLVGVQTYPRSGKVSRKAPGTPEGFIPKSESESLAGDFYPQAADFNQKPVWEVLRTYLNEPVNEMYTSLRVSINNDILPTFIARQLPFSSRLFNKASVQNQTTAFVDLPRWVLSPKLVESDDLGVSNALRFNYFYLPSSDKIGNAYYDAGQKRVTNPPYVDTVDIERSGLRMYSKEVAGHTSDTRYTVDKSPGRYWSRMMADAISGQHLRESGTVTAVFLQEPIPVGDNLEYDGGIFHIEAISHQGSISGDGRRMAETVFSLSGGISTASDLADDNVYLTQRGVDGELFVEEQHDKADPNSGNWRFYEASIHDRR